ncbi:MAG: 3-oxoacyl-ACP reductase FabG [Candidatus Muiribacteriota bacterium]
MKKLENKVAIITGGARGIGKITAEIFLKHNAKVAIFDLDEKQLAETEEKLSEFGDIKALKVNVSSMDEVKQGVDKVVKKYGKIDIMIANAGITRDSMFHKMTEYKFDSVVDVNLKGAFNSASAVVPFMREQKKGKIIFTSSVVGEYGNIGQTNYAATKAGVIGMAKSMAKELGRKNVQVNVVAPGYTNTEMMQTVPDKILDTIKANTPMQRLAEPEEIGNAFLYLSSEDADFITGHVLSVNGGLTL